MQSLVTEAWVEPIFRKHGGKAEEQKEEEWLKFAEYCGDALPGDMDDARRIWQIFNGKEVDPRRRPSGLGADDEPRPTPSGQGAALPFHVNRPWPLPQLTGSRFVGKLKEMGHKAKGADNWEVEELACLPTELWDDIAHMFGEMEQSAEVRWPEILATAAIALIPKGEGYEPIKQRPITLFSVIYRLYTSLRYDDTEDWQQSWIPPEVYGARKGVDALDATWELALEVEEAYLALRDLIAALLDNSIFFDFFKRNVIFPLLLALGAPPGLIKVISAFYDQAVRFIRIGQHCGDTFHPENGLGQ